MRLVLIPAIAVMVGWMPGTAQAWRHTGVIWPDEAFPIPYQTDVMSEGCWETLTPEQCLAEVEAAWTVWAAVPDVPVDAVYVGELPEGTPLQQRDGINAIQFRDDLEVGVAAGTLSWTFGDSFVVDGRTYSWIDEADIAFRNLDSWDLTDECPHEQVLRGAVAHELGHTRYPRCCLHQGHWHLGS